MMHRPPGKRWGDEISGLIGHRRRGFTLVELLVGMVIILILASMTLAALNIAGNGDRIPGASRQTQSMILGARDRAIYAGEPRGVRLITDPNNPRAVSSFVFIGAPQSYGENRGTVTVYQYDHDSDTSTPPIWIVQEENPALSGWGRLRQRGLLRPGARITLGNEPRWYTIGAPQVGSHNRIWAPLTRSPGSSKAGLSYSVTLAPSVMAGEEPRVLGRGVVIDLESSRVHNKIPQSWYTVTNDGGDGSGTVAERLNDVVTYNTELDIMFNERGTVHGPLASQGVVSLVLADAADVLNGFRAWHGNLGTTDVNGDGVKDERTVPSTIVTIFTNGGTVITAPVDETDSDGDNVLNDPWYLAETGGEG